MITDGGCQRLGGESQCDRPPATRGAVLQGKSSAECQRCLCWETEHIAGSALG